MDQWFFAEGNSQQRGPLPADELIALYRSSRIALDTLVWRDGMAQWQPLETVAAEIGLDIPPVADTVEIPEPGPAVPPALPATPAAPVTPAPPVAVPPPRKGLSGCAIVGIVAAVIVVLVLIVGAVLAAIALPVYQEYVARSKTSEALVTLAPIKLAVAGFHGEYGRCPVNDDEGFQPAESYADGAIGAVRIGRFDNGHCGVEAELTVPGSPSLDGKLLWLDYNGAGHWECSGEPDDKYLPLECHG
ncbi:GYF domain-containing protein [Stenotrophomonas maltophilia]|uniref:GYF domain-containing protein n=1 Tax=Stenotrophomonas maltophilia TaxID=40324 RepID=UPI003BA11640